MSMRATINRWRGRAPPIFRAVDRSVLHPLWTFTPSRPRWTIQVIRTKAFMTGFRLRPARQELLPASPARRWTCYFVYLPDGQLTDAHRFTLARLRALDRRLMVVCATPTPEMVPAELSGQVDALLWKSLSGFDFSAYILGLEVLARLSPGADVLVMNDSVYGPFYDVEPLLAAAPWQLTGFTAFSSIENHLQSYAFQLRDVTPDVVRALRCVMPKRLAFNRYADVIYCQETRLARVASRAMSVGALWFANVKESEDPSLCASLDLLDGGFPFLKKSLFTRNEGIQPRDLLVRALEERGHPVPTRGG